MAVLALLALAPTDADAQTTFRNRSENESVAERSHDEYQSHGVPFGAFILSPVIETTVESSDNFFANDFNAGAEDELTYTLRGGLDVNSDWSRHLLKFSVGGQRAMHDKFAKDDATTGHVGGEFRLDLARASELGVGGRHENMVEERTAPDAVLSSLKPVEYSFSEAFVYGGHTFNRLRVSARIAQREYDYDDVFRLAPVTNAPIVIDEDFRDHEERIGTARLEYMVSPRMALLLEGVWNDREYDQFGRSSNGHVYSTGASFELARLIDGEVRIGYLEQEYDDPAVGTVDGLAVNADIDWYPTQLTSVSFTADRQVEDSGGSGNASYLLTRAGITVDHELYRNIVLSAGASAGKREYEGIDRDDDFTAFDLSAAYLLNRNVALRGGYGHEQVNSDGMSRNRDFDVNRAYVSLAFRL